MNLGPSTAPDVPPPFPGVPGTPGVKVLQGGCYNGHTPDKWDRFYLSPAHYALVLYTALIESGRMSEEGLKQFNHDGSTVEMIGAEHSPGFDMMGGSLAQTLSQAAGVAQAKKMKGQDDRIWVFLSDGEFQEGQTWETLNVLSHYKLDNIGVYIDINGQQCDGLMTDVMGIEPLDKKLEAFGARVHKVDGNDIEALVAPAEEQADGRPLFVLAYTDPCYKIPLLKKRSPKLHYVRFTDPAEREEYRQYYNKNMTDGVNGLIREDFTDGN
ncbi:MAG: transketolase [Spirochaetales bacterium]|nr:transketolase [Spirochaetales bacterium]